jgi:hypothetical protein
VEENMFVLGATGFSGNGHDDEVTLMREWDPRWNHRSRAVTKMSFRGRREKRKRKRTSSYGRDGATKCSQIDYSVSHWMRAGEFECTRAEISHQYTLANHSVPFLRYYKRNIYDGMILEYRQSAVMETTAITQKNIQPTPSETLTRERRDQHGERIVQSLDFAASLSSFFLCQLAAPILNLRVGRKDHRSARIG